MLLSYYNEHKSFGSAFTTLLQGYRLLETHELGDCTWTQTKPSN